MKDITKMTLNEMLDAGMSVGDIMKSYNDIAATKGKDQEAKKAAEAAAAGGSIHSYDPKGKVAEAYRNLTKEVLSRERQRQKAKSACI